MFFNSLKVNRLKVAKGTTFLFVLLFAFSLFKFTACAQSITSQFVDLVFKIDSKTYMTKGVNKPLDTAPFIENGSTLVPFRTILEELGYVIDWNAQTSTITATREDSTIKLKINSKLATVDGVQQNMSVAPKVVSGRTVVPLRFISENSGANVEWDDKAKTITITKVGRYNTGTVMFYEKEKNLVSLYDGSEIKKIDLVDQEIVNWYSFKGQVLLTIFEKSRNTNSFQIYKDGKFEVLTDNLGHTLESFDMKDTFEYNDNLLIHCYDRTQKFNKLYRFDGQKLYLVEDNFYVGKYYLFKDKLVINKYDNKRNYTVVAFNKSSWTPGILKKEFIINESVQDSNYLYFSGNNQEGSKKPLAVYDGNSVNESSFKILNENIGIDINKIVMFNGKLHAIVSGELVTIEKDGIYKLLFVDKAGNYVGYSVNNIKLYKGKLYIGVSKDSNYYNQQYKSIKVASTTNGFVLEISDKYTTQTPYKIGTGNMYFSVLGNTNYYKNVLDKFKTSEFRIENDKLLILGQETDDSDKALNVFDGSKMTRALDVSSILNTVSIDQNTFIDVKDTNRITKEQRNTVLLYSKNEIINLAIGMETKKWDSIKGSLIIYGYEKDIKRYKIYSYGSEFKELYGNFNTSYWQKFDAALFVSGTNLDTRNDCLLKFENSDPQIINENLNVNKMIKAKGNYYIINGINKDSTTATYNKNVLYIYDDSKGDFIEMKANVKITDMIFVN